MPNIEYRGHVTLPVTNPGKKRIKTMPTITAERIKSLITSNHAVDIRPIKRVVTVDGYQYFTITKSELAKVKRG